MGKRIKKLDMKKEKGFLYFVDRAGDISKVDSKGSTPGPKEKEKVEKVGLKKRPMHFYYVEGDYSGGDCYIVEVGRIRPGAEGAKARAEKKKKKLEKSKPKNPWK